MAWTRVVVVQVERTSGIQEFCPFSKQIPWGQHHAMLWSN